MTISHIGVSSLHNLNLPSVLVVPNLIKNLLSVSKLTKNLLSVLSRICRVKLFSRGTLTMVSIVYQPSSISVLHPWLFQGFAHLFTVGTNVWLIHMSHYCADFSPHSSSLFLPSIFPLFVTHASSGKVVVYTYLLPIFLFYLHLILYTQMYGDHLPYFQ